jgi:glycosyltransferase involved in cell wall biosynthesis
VAITVVHVPYTYAPDPVGGTENYVHQLAHAMRRYGVDSRVVAPGSRSQAYGHEGVGVRRFAVAGRPLSLGELYGTGDPEAAENFGRMAWEPSPHLLHLHAFTPAVSTRIVEAARERRVPVVFTYHTPTVSCQRGTLLEWGTRDCDGVLDVRRCTQCSLHGAGAPSLLARAFARVPRRVGAGLARLGLSGGAWTALRMTHLMQMRHQATRRLLALVDHIIVPAQWALELLAANGVAREKITYSAQGLAAAGAPPGGHQSGRGGPVRVVYLGRLTPVKGAHLLVDAIRSRPALDVSLDVYGITQPGADESYGARLRDSAAGDARIRFHPAVPPQHVEGLIRDHDLVAVPSRFAETGPLVVLEAFAAGVPVIASDVRGLRERIRRGVDGILVPGDAAAAWADALGTLSHERLAGLRRRIEAPRSMDVVAREVAAVYEKVLGSAGG